MIICQNAKMHYVIICYLVQRSMLLLTLKNIQLFLGLKTFSAIKHIICFNILKNKTLKILALSSLIEE